MRLSIRSPDAAAAWRPTAELIPRGRRTDPAFPDDDANLYNNRRPYSFGSSSSSVNDDDDDDAWRAARAVGLQRRRVPSSRDVAPWSTARGDARNIVMSEWNVPLRDLSLLCVSFYPLEVGPSSRLFVRTQPLADGFTKRPPAETAAAMSMESSMLVLQLQSVVVPACVWSRRRVWRD